MLAMAAHVHGHYGVGATKYEKRKKQMNQEWSELNKRMQGQLKKRDTFDAGIGTLFALRDSLWNSVLTLREELSKDDFHAIPFLHEDGYHNKTIAYSLWHIFRIEDIVAHTLIKGNGQVFFNGNYQNRIHSPFITTGNELVKQEIADFSRQLELDELFVYLSEVKQSSESVLKNLSYDDLRRKISEERREQLKSLHVVSDDERAIWLIDYWCNKDVRGLIQMPFSRHWIMHIEACLRIRNKIIAFSRSY